jgi:hypothetical protein
MIASTATIRIKSGKTLEQLAEQLHEVLSVPAFWFDSDIDPPHRLTAMTECLGHELWLYHNGSEYQLTIEATMNVHDRVEGSLADVSEWLAKYIGTVSGLDCTITQTTTNDP